MKTVLLVCSLTLVSGCQWMVRTETVEVKIPVPVACVEPAEVPNQVPRAEGQLRKEDSPVRK